MTFSDIDAKSVIFPGESSFFVHPDDYTTLSGITNTNATVLGNCILYKLFDGRYVRIYSAPVGAYNQSNANADSFVPSGVIEGW